MKKKIGLLALIAIASVALMLGTASAQTQQNAPPLREKLHELKDIIETGTYEDLVELREQYDRNIMPWIDSQEDFELLKELHEARKTYFDEHPEEMPQGPAHRHQRRFPCTEGE